MIAHEVLIELKMKNEAKATTIVSTRQGTTVSNVSAHPLIQSLWRGSNVVRDEVTERGTGLAPGSRGRGCCVVWGVCVRCDSARAGEN